MKVNFEADVKANDGRPFVVHIVVPYSKELYDRLVSMDHQTYFTSADRLKKEYKDSLQVFSYDIIPGKDKLNQVIKLKSYTKAKAAFLFAKYNGSGKFMENIGDASSIVVKFLPHKFEIINGNIVSEIVETLDD